MHLQIDLPEELAARLQQEATRTGKDLQTLAIESIESTLDFKTEDESQEAIDQWLVNFNAWLATHRSRNPQMDDSRDSIYPDR